MLNTRSELLLVKSSLPNKQLPLRHKINAFNGTSSILKHQCQAMCPVNPDN